MSAISEYVHQHDVPRENCESVDGLFYFWDEAGLCNGAGYETAEEASRAARSYIEWLAGE